MFSTLIVFPAKRADEKRWAKEINECAAVLALPDQDKEMLAQNGNEWAQIWKAVECYSNRDLGNSYGPQYADDINQTEFWLRKAARQSNITAQYMLWQFFQALTERGYRNLPADRDLWLATAAKGGHIEAQETLKQRG
jgi:TPR repeat protein